MSRTWRGRCLGGAAGAAITLAALWLALLSAAAAAVILHAQAPHPGPHRDAPAAPTDEASTWPPAVQGFLLLSTPVFPFGPACVSFSYLRMCFRWVDLERLSHVYVCVSVSFSLRVLLASTYVFRLFELARPSPVFSLYCHYAACECALMLPFVDG